MPFPTISRLKVTEDEQVGNDRIQWPVYTHNIARIEIQLRTHVKMNTET